MVSEFPLRVTVHGPLELGLQVSLEDLVDRHSLEFAPADRDPGIHVIDLAGAKGNFLIHLSLKLNFILLNTIF